MERIEGACWSIVNVRLVLAAPLIVATAAIMFAQPARAAGTTAGTTISNTASVTYTNPMGTAVTVPSNKVDLRVDELLNVTVASADSGDVAAQPGSAGNVLKFSVTNTGNGSEAFRLTPNGTLGGDQFDPAVTNVYLDNPSQGTVGVYDPGVDILYAPGSNDPVLAPDASRTVFLVSTIPGAATDGQRGQAQLTAAAVKGTGAPGTTFAGQGQGGGDAVVGSTGADGVAGGFYVVSAATIGFVKSATVADPFGGTKSVPGAIVTYTLVATVGGSGTMSGLVIGDPIPANTTYQPGTLTLQGAALTDAAGDDAGEVPGNSNVVVRLGSVAGGQTRTVTFKVKIN